MADHVFTEGEKKCLEAYWRECSKTPRKNLIKLVRHINMFNPMPSEKSWEYIFFDRQANVDFRFPATAHPMFESILHE